MYSRRLPPALSYPGPHTSLSSCRWLSSLPGFRSSTSSRCHSVGVSLMSPSECGSASATEPFSAERALVPPGPARVTRLAVRSTVRSPRASRGGSSAAGVRRTAARIRGSSSFIPDRLVWQEVESGRRLGGRGAQDGAAHPGQQLVHPERLGDVVVGAGVERLHLVGRVG